jgi:hypothetical protein
MMNQFQSQLDFFNQSEAMAATNNLREVLISSINKNALERLGEDTISEIMSNDECVDNLCAKFKRDHSELQELLENIQESRGSHAIVKIRNDLDDKYDYFDNTQVKTAEEYMPADEVAVIEGRLSELPTISIPQVNEFFDRRMAKMNAEAEMELSLEEVEEEVFQMAM